MDKGTFKKIFTTNTPHRISKLTTLAVATSVLVTMIVIDASALSKDAYSTTAKPANNTSIFASESSLKLLFGREHHHVLTPRQPAAASAKTGSDRRRSPSGPNGTSTTTTTTRTATTTTASTTTTTTRTAAPTTTTTTAAPTSTPIVPAAASNSYLIGALDLSEPSGYAPPVANALSGYNRVYSTDFKGSTLPGGWDPYSGQPGGDPGAQFSPSAITVEKGLLNINALEQSGDWVTGGVCNCGVSFTYGAYFVRSRMTGAGPTGVELLWPDANEWPPEIDFNETLGGTSSTTATVHYTSSNEIIHQTFNIDMTQWHTWGVIWTPASITYTVDGRVWGSESNVASIPDTPMHLSLQSQTWCASGFACPTTPESMQVDWVAEYSPNS
jgi:hypothetical protein